MGLHDRVGRRAAIRVLGVVCANVLAPTAWAGSGKSRDLVVLDHERWLDTLQGSIKNFGRRSARDVTLIVKFFDKKKTALGTQRVNVGELRPGEHASWRVAINEKHRAATRYEFETHAIWQ